MSVPDINGEWYVYDKGAYTSAVDTALARGSKDKSAEVEYALTRESFGPLTKRSLKIFVPIDDIKRAKTPLNAKSDATEVLRDLMLLDKERRVASIMQNSATFGSGHYVTKSGTGQWSDYDNSDPLADIETGSNAVELDSFKSPNTLLFDKRVWRVLRRHPKLVGLFTNVSGGLLTKEQFLSLVEEYGITKLIVTDTKQNTAAPGQTATGDWVWGKHAWLLYLADGEVLDKTITFGKSLYMPDGRNVATNESWEPDGTYLREQDDVEEKVMAKEAGYAIFNAIA
ncbi:hypothetical protein ACSCB1_35370 [Streptomyces europaeiscabiei]|uniref:hypothetical protein n=1 Tax=Streptomyces europaeiscabiei TaxID=146819 RepID=UPI00131E66E8|nr:hypothetical protein [Streptomyces europaeiscabiei]